MRKCKSVHCVLLQFELTVIIYATVKLHKHLTKTIRINNELPKSYWSGKYLFLYLFVYLQLYPFRFQNSFSPTTLVLSLITVYWNNQKYPRGETAKRMCRSQISYAVHQNYLNYYFSLFLLVTSNAYITAWPQRQSLCKQSTFHTLLPMATAHFSRFHVAEPFTSFSL